MSQINANSQISEPIFDIESLLDISRPIREISAYWNIDLTEILDQVLEKMAKIDISTDFNPDIFSFAQAGLYIQNTTSIYTKKVKHLHELATQSSSFDEPTDKASKKARKKNRIVEWISDNKLIDIPDPEPCDCTIMDNEETSVELTTNSRIPFSLSYSLEQPMEGSSDSFRINKVPDSKTGVIILDMENKELDFNPDKTPDTRTVNEEFFEDEDELLSDDDIPVPHINHESSISDVPETAAPPTIDEDEEAPQELNEDEDAYDQKDDQVERSFSPKYDLSYASRAFNPSPVQKRKKSKQTRNTFVLNPDEVNFSITSRKYKKLKKIFIPTSFEKKEKPPTVSKKPFNQIIFGEMFKLVNQHRQKLLLLQDLQAIEEVPVEHGREHIREQFAVFVEPPPPNIEEDDVSFEPMIHDFEEAESSERYKIFCSEAISRMIDSSKNATILSQTMKNLEKWESEIAPILENELSREKFDITKTREWIVRIAHEKGGEVLFSYLKQGLKKFEVARIFYSCLILANSGDITIEQDNYPRNEFLIRLEGDYQEIISRLCDDDV